MATYEFECNECEIYWEKQMSMNVDHIDKCPECGKEVHSLITGGSGFIFKGDGFPSHDMRKEKEMNADASRYYKEADEVLPGKKEAEAIKKTKKYKKIVGKK